MKYLIILIFLLVLGCHKEEECYFQTGKKNSDIKNGISSSESNITDWSDSKISLLNISNNKLNILNNKIISFRTNQWTKSCELYLLNFTCLLQKGTHTLNKERFVGDTYSYFSVFGGGDEPHGNFFPNLNDTSNWIKITSINKDTTCIKGEFNLTCIYEKTIHRFHNLPDTLLFKKGTFTINK
jgi:hypothetical protein